MVDPIMNRPAMMAVAHAHVAGDKGRIAADERMATSKRRSSEVGIPQSAGNRLALRARFVDLCQEAGLVPVVAPEILLDGNRSPARRGAVAGQVRRAMLVQLAAQDVALAAIILKSAAAPAGRTNGRQPAVDEIANATVASLSPAVPAAVPGATLLSGAQNPSLASDHLNATNRGVCDAGKPLPRALTFSFAHAIRQPALQMGKSAADGVASARQALLRRARLNRVARRGDYTVERRAA